jgi:hypothetical protein
VSENENANCRAYKRGNGVQAKEHAAMTKEQPAKRNKTKTVAINDPEHRKGEPNVLGGSQSDHWNNVLANQALQALWVGNSDEGPRERQIAERQELMSLLRSM